jgi:hypothetical protein
MRLDNRTGSVAPFRMADTSRLFLLDDCSAPVGLVFEILISIYGKHQQQLVYVDDAGSVRKCSNDLRLAFNRVLAVAMPEDTPTGEITATLRLLTHKKD